MLIIIYLTLSRCLGSLLHCVATTNQNLDRNTLTGAIWQCALCAVPDDRQLHQSCDGPTAINLPAVVLRWGLTTWPTLSEYNGQSNSCICSVVGMGDTSPAGISIRQPFKKGDPTLTNSTPDLRGTDGLAQFRPTMRRAPCQIRRLIHPAC